MTIQSGDIKLVASSIMSDAPESGGSPSANTIADAVSNAIFPDISELDRSGGRVNLRKVFASVQTSTTDTFLGSNVIVAEPPHDPRVSVTLFSTGNVFDTRAEAQSRVEAYLNKGSEWAGFLFENHIAGQRVIQLFQRTNDVLPNVGQTLVLTQDEGLTGQKEQYVRATAVSTITRTFTDDNGNNYNANVVTLSLSDALRYDFKGSSATKFFTRKSDATKVRDTVVADAGTYVGVVPLSQAAAMGDFTVKGASIYTQLVPSAQTETPIADIRVNGLSAALVPTGDALTTTISMGFTTTTNMHVGGPIYPGSLSIVRSGVTATDQGGKLVSASSEVGQVDYDNGIVTLSTNLWGTGADSHTVTFRPAALPDLVSDQRAIRVTAESRSLNYTLVLPRVPLPRTVSVSFLAQGRWYVLRDNGAGVLAGNDSSYGVGTVNYSTGSLLVTLGALPDVGSSIVIQSYNDLETTPASNTVLLSPKACFIFNTDGVEGGAKGSMALPRKAVIVNWVVGGVTKYVHDADGMGLLTGNGGTGTVDYATGVVTVSPTALPAPGTIFTMGYGTDYTAAEYLRTHPPVAAQPITPVDPNVPSSHPIRYEEAH